MLMIGKTLPKGYTQMTREELLHVPTPDATDTWQPIPHAQTAGSLISRLQDRGLMVKEESWSVRSGAVYPDGTAKSKREIPGARLHGVVDLFEDKAFNLPPGIRPSITLTHANDKSASLRIFLGARVLVCSNGMMIGKVIEHARRKHTSRIDVLKTIDDALAQMENELTGLGPIYNEMNETEIDDRQAHDLIVKAAQEGAFSSAKILPVAENWTKPPHKEFAPRNLWSLYNAATETMKSQSPERQIDGFQALNRVMMPVAA